MIVFVGLVLAFILWLIEINLTHIADSLKSIELIMKGNR